MFWPDDAQTRENCVSHWTGRCPAALHLEAGRRSAVRESREPPDRAMPSPAYVQVAAAVEDDSSLPVAAVVLALTWMAV